MSAIEDEMIFIEGNGNLSKTFFKMQEDIRPDLAIEVGAYRAEFSFAMANKFGIKAIAFEANPNVFDMYTQTDNIYNFYRDVNNYLNTDLVDYLNIAISDYDGETEINVHQHPLVANNSIKLNINHPILKSYPVKCRSLDSYFQNLDFNNAALWIDAEGANKEVLQGAKKTLQKCSSVFIETENTRFWHDSWVTEEVESFLKDNGFKKLAEEDIYVDQKNQIFIKEEKS